MNPNPAIADMAEPPARILIVDDEPDNLELLEVILAWEGFVILTAASGEEALATVAQKPVDLVLLDIMMPDMNGYEVVAKIKGNLATKNIPVLMISALVDVNVRTLALTAGADDFLAKPLQRAELVLRVRKLLRKTRAAGDGSQVLEGEVGERAADPVKSEGLLGMMSTLTRWHRGRPLSEADAETLRAHVGGVNKTKLVIA